MANSNLCASAPAIFNFNNSEVRIVSRDGEPWFVAADVCAALGYQNSRKAIADHLDDDERCNQSLQRGGELTIINESGLYALVLRSRKPEARKFAKWVTSEVLPAIRKTGSYTATYSRNPTDSLTIEQADVLRNLLTDAFKRLPKEQQGVAMLRGWSKLKAHFKCAYRDIPQSEFTEAVSIISRHITSGEYLEREDFVTERCGPGALAGSSKELADIAMQSIVGKQFLTTVIKRDDGKMFHYMKHVHDDAFLLCPGDIPWLLDKYNMVAIQRSAAQGIAASLGNYAA